MNNEATDRQSTSDEEKRDGNLSTESRLEVPNHWHRQQQNDSIRNDVENGGRPVELGIIDTACGDRRIIEAPDRGTGKSGYEGVGDSDHSNEYHAHPDDVMKSLDDEDPVVKEKDRNLDDGVARDIEYVVCIVELYQHNDISVALLG